MKNKMIKLLVLTGFVLTILLGFAGCNTTASLTPIITTDITDNAVVFDSEYKFSASATIDGNNQEIVVSSNGAIITGDSQDYSVNLQKGENTITISVYTAVLTEKTYKVTYRADFAINTDIEELKVENDILTFEASITLNDELCNSFVIANGSLLEAAQEKYSLPLVKGLNEVEIKAVKGEKTHSKLYTINYNGFSIITNAYDFKTAKADYSFMAGAAAGSEKCDFDVILNDEEVAQIAENSYSVTFEVGVNTLKIQARQGNMTNFVTFTIKYTDEKPTLNTTIVEGKTYKGSVFNFDVYAKDGLEEKIDSENISVKGGYDNGYGNYFNSTAAIVWDDTSHTSLRFNLKTVISDAYGTPEVGKTYEIKIKTTVTDAFENTVENIYTINYECTANGQPIGNVYFSLEAFNISLGYLQKPIELEVQEGRAFAYDLLEILAELGYSTNHSGGSSDPGSGFYLGSIKGEGDYLSGNKIDDELWPSVLSTYKDAKQTVANDSALGQFVFCSGAGWMYNVNGRYPNYGFSDYYPTDGDIVRVQFTLLLGRDIGGGNVAAGGSSLLTNGAKLENVTKLLAQINSQNLCDTYGEDVYNAAIKTVTKWNPQNTDIDNTVKRLQKTYWPQ